MNNMYEFIDRVADPAEEQSKHIYSMLDRELRQLKFKVARCSMKCFQEKPLPEAFACEQKCASSVQKVMQLLKTRQEQLHKTFEQCMDHVSYVLQGATELTEFDSDGGMKKCVEAYKAGLIDFKKQATQEFSYYF